MAYVVDPRDTSRPTQADMVRQGADEIRALKEAFNDAWAPRLINETAYTVVADDIGHLLVMRSGGQITIPPDLPFGLFGVTGLQATTVSASGASNTLIVPPSLMSTLYEDYAFAVVMRVSQGEWLISGNLMFNASSAETTPDRTENPVTVLQAALEVVKTDVADHEVRITDLENPE